MKIQIFSTIIYDDFHRSREVRYKNFYEYETTVLEKLDSKIFLITMASLCHQTVRKSKLSATIPLQYNILSF